LRQELKEKGMEVTIRGKTWNLAGEGCGIERITGYILLYPSGDWILKKGMNTSGDNRLSYCGFRNSQYQVENGFWSWGGLEENPPGRGVLRVVSGVKGGF